MLYANVSGIKTLPTPKTVGTCPGCDAEVLSKCGEIKVWHWAHRSLVECDSWWENEGEWHRNLKQVIGGNDPSRIEVTIRRDGKWHRADCISIDGWVVELQHSPISPADIRAREAFYGPKMIWVLDYTDKIPKHDVRLDTIQRRVALCYPTMVMCIDGEDRWSMTKDEFIARITTEGVAFYDAEALNRAKRKAEREHYDRFYPIYKAEQDRVHEILRLAEWEVRNQISSKIHKEDMAELEEIAPRWYLPVKGCGLLETPIFPKMDLFGYYLDHGYITPKQALLYLRSKQYLVDEFPWVSAKAISEELLKLKPEEVALVAPYLHPEARQEIRALKLGRTADTRFRQKLDERFAVSKDPIIYEVQNTVDSFSRGYTRCHRKYVSCLKRIPHKTRMLVAEGVLDEDLNPIDYNKVDFTSFFDADYRPPSEDRDSYPIDHIDYYPPPEMENIDDEEYVAPDDLGDYDDEDIGIMARDAAERAK